MLEATGSHIGFQQPVHVARGALSRLVSPFCIRHVILLDDVCTFRRAPASSH